MGYDSQVMNQNAGMLRLSSIRFLWLLTLTAPPVTFAQYAPPPVDTPEAETEGARQQQTGRTLDLSNPRAAMRTFLVAMQDTAGDHPERIDDAVKCLDTSDLGGESEAKHARLLASRLHSIIDKGGVNLDDIPEEGEGTDYLFHQLKVEEGVTSIPEIRLVRDPASGHWQFSALTLASIPALEEATVKQAEPPKPSESKIASARRSPRATMTTFLNAMNAEPPNIEEAVLCLDPSGRDREAWSVRGNDLAIKLKNVMDKIEEVVLSEFPDTPDGSPFVWYTSDTGNIVVGRIEVEPAADDNWQYTPQKGEWRFTSKTLDRIDDLFIEFEDKQIVDALQEAGVTEDLPLRLRLERQFPEWMRAKFLYLHVWQWMALAALLPLGWLIQIMATEFAALVLRAWLKRRKITIERKARRRVVSSVGTLVMIVCWFYAIQQFGLPEALLAFLLKAAKLVLGVSVVWVGYRCVDIIGGHIAADKDVRLTHFDDVLIPLLRTVLRFFIIIVAVLLVFDMLGYKPLTVLGVLGIGGIALAFAAQDTLGNFFGSITVLFDRPFGIGDWIVVGDVEGTVERVGFRSTRVRTFYNSVITIPNSKMVNTQVDNFGARRFRRAKIMLSITYSTPPGKIEAFCEGIRELVRLHPYTRKDYYHVYFNKFAGSSLDILLYIFFEVPDWSTELRERHYFFLDILRLAKRLGVEFAFPTQTVWLGRTAAGARAPEEPAKAPVEVDADADTIGVGEAAKVYGEVYGATPAYRGPVVIDGKPRSKQDQADGAAHDGGRS